MGYGLPAAVGASVGYKDGPVILIAGDGSFQMSVQELGTIKQEKLPVKIIIFNNQRLGMVRELQKNIYGKRYTEVFLEENPDFVKLAEAYDIRGERIEHNDEIEDALERLIKHEGSYLLECKVSSDEPTL